MRKNEKKLRLSIATVKSLGDDDLRGVAGGGRASVDTVCPSMWCSDTTCLCSMTVYPPCDPNYTNLCPLPETDGCPISY